MRRMIVAFIVMLGLPAIAAGQHVSGSAIGSIGTSGGPEPNWFIRPLIGPPSAGYPPRDPPPNFAIPPLIGPPSIGLPLPQIGLPLPQIGLPLPPIGLQPRIDGDVRLTAFAKATARQEAGHPGRHHSRQAVVFWPIFVVPQFAMTMMPASAPEPAPTRKEPATGSLVLEVEPGTAQVFIDGYYVGTPDDFSAKRGELALETGAHRVDINAPGYESVSFDVKISPNQSIVYRRVLKAVEFAPPPAPFIPTRPATFYMIPGCYLGSVPPKDAGLPSTCDVSRAQTFTIK